MHLFGLLNHCLFKKSLLILLHPKLRKTISQDKKTISQSNDYNLLSSLFIDPSIHALSDESKNLYFQFIEQRWRCLIHVEKAENFLSKADIKFLFPFFACNHAPIRLHMLHLLEHILEKRDPTFIPSKLIIALLSNCMISKESSLLIESLKCLFLLCKTREYEQINLEQIINRILFHIQPQILQECSNEICSVLMANKDSYQCFLPMIFLISCYSNMDETIDYISNSYKTDDSIFQSYIQKAYSFLFPFLMNCISPTNSKSFIFQFLYSTMSKNEFGDYYILLSVVHSISYSLIVKQDLFQVFLNLIADFLESLAIKETPQDQLVNILISSSIFFFFRINFPLLNSNSQFSQIEVSQFMQILKDFHENILNPQVQITVFSFLDIKYESEYKFVQQLLFLISKVILPYLHIKLQFPNEQLLDPFLLYTLCICAILQYDKNEQVLNEKFSLVWKIFQETRNENFDSKFFDQMTGMINFVLISNQIQCTIPLKDKLKMPYIVEFKESQLQIELKILFDLTPEITFFFYKTFSTFRKKLQTDLADFHSLVSEHEIPKKTVLDFQRMLKSQAQKRQKEFKYNQKYAHLLIQNSKSYGGILFKPDDDIKWKFTTRLDSFFWNNLMKINKNIAPHHLRINQEKENSLKAFLNANTQIISNSKDTFRVKYRSFTNVFKGTVEFQTDGFVFQGENEHTFKFIPKSLLNKYFSCNFTNIEFIFRRRYRLEDIGCEVFLNDRKSRYFVFESKDDRNSFFEHFNKFKPNIQSTQKFSFYNCLRNVCKGIVQNYSCAQLMEKSKITFEWEKRTISNYEYLVYLNLISGRSFNDLFQYPIFPWILSDYISENIDLSNENVYRTLSKPIGALNTKNSKG